jgi:glycosyltransferase involved in cell wall biosynthesis
MVNVAIVTYNQENFIAKAIESALMQKTLFSFTIVIGEDCSSDSTYEICNRYYKEFPHKIVLLKNESNVGLVRNYQKVFNACSAKYVAILEGDDYWTDNLKLQKQVDIMENDKDIGVVHTDYDKLLTNGKLISAFKKSRGIKPLNGYVFENIIKENFITSVTACFRKELFDNYIDFPEFLKQELITIDYSLWMELSYHCKVHYLEASTAVYRVLPSSLSNSPDFKKKESYYNKGRGIKKYYIKKYSPRGQTAEDVDRIYNKSLLVWAIRLKSHEKALEYFNELIKMHVNPVVPEILIKNTVLFKFLGFFYTTRSKLNDIFSNN